MYYVISDLHGEYDKFIEMLKLIDFKLEDRLYILGDVIDRGNDSVKLLQYLMKQSNMELLLGNHEEMMLQSLVNCNRTYYNCWIPNGGASTLSQFDKLDALQQKEILSYIGNCELYKIVGSYILVHAGIDMTYNYEDDIDAFMALQKRDVLLWTKDKFINQDKKALGAFTIIFGHTPTSFMIKGNPLKIWHSNGKIGIDCGACFKGGRLGCLRLNDMQEFYI